MPIYAYRCTSCGHAKDVLQKVSDPLLTECPACGAATFVKQVTAAGFQLKGSGWYVTDFRGGNSAGKAEGEGKEAADKSGEKDAGKAAETSDAKNSGEAKSAASQAPAPGPAASAAPAASAPAAPSPAPSSSGG